MKPTVRKLLWVGLGLAIVLGSLWEFYPLGDAQARVTSLPLQGYGLSGTDLPVSDTARDILGKANVLKRLYQVGDQQVIVWIIDGSANRHAVHDPLYCVRGAGWDIVSQNSYPVPGGNAALIRIRKSGEDSEAMVWFSDSITRHASAPRYWWQTTIRRLTLGLAGPEPVLVNVQPLDNRPVNWRQLVDQFPALFDL